MVQALGRKGYWALPTIILLSVFLVSPGFFSIDEAIYHLGARAIAEHGSFFIDNGFSQLHAESLKLRLLVDGRSGLTPQYPAGTALIGGLLIPWLGARAFILLNAVSGVLMLFTVRNICLRQYNSEAVAGIAIALLVLGTFWFEYAVGIWPHMLSAFFAVQAYWYALRHLDSDENSDRFAILSGLFAGAGMPFRLDAILAVPAIGLVFLLFAPRFIRSSLCFGAGVLPTLAAMSVLNYLKFGTLNPLSYGRSGGNTDLAAYGAFLFALGVGFSLLVAWRTTRWKVGHRAAILSLIVVSLALLIVPATSAWLFRLWNGFLGLVVDARYIHDPRAGVKPGPGNTLLFWTLAKKALGQSMPWLGIAAMLITSGVPKHDRRFVATQLIYVATMTLPFFLLVWHGGGGSNMRYFMPVLPGLCTLCAKPLHQLWQSVPNAMLLVAAGVWGSVVLGIAWVLLHPSGYVGVQQIVSSYLLLALALAAMAAGIDWRFRQPARKLTLALFSGASLLALCFAISDFATTEERRSMSYGISEAVGRLPPKSLVITFPEWAVATVPGGGKILSSREPEYQRPDEKLINDALDAGYRVFMTSFEFIAERDLQPGIEAVPTRYTFHDGWMIELRRRVPSEEQSPLLRSVK